MSPLPRDEDLEGALDAVKAFLPKAPHQLRIALYVYLCSFSLLQETYRQRPPELEPEDITSATVAGWAAEFFSQYKDNSNLDETYNQFISWLKTKQSSYIENLS